MARLQDKVALVTGAAADNGLGAATARRFAEEGAVVYLTDIEAEGAERNAAAIRSAGGKARAMRHDVTSEAEWDAVFAAILDAEGQLDVLVNNAGIADLRPLGEIDLDAWRRINDINLTSVYLGTRRAVDTMRKAGKGGSIINMSSAAGLTGVPNCTSYCATKGGVRLFSKAVAIECAKENIRCNSIHPGLIATEMGQLAVNLHGDAVLAGCPMGRPEDIANAALFLASDESAFITGIELAVDGGTTAQ